MRFYLLFLIALFYIQNCFSQVVNYQNEINNQVWKQFIESFEMRDEAGFQSVHSKDFVRVIRDNNIIRGFEEHFKPKADSIKVNWGNWKRTITLRFIQRIASADKAFEVGYYRTSNTNVQIGEKRVSYGKFYVLLRKENGVWKILMDADANEGTDELIFQSASPMEIIEPD